MYANNAEIANVLATESPFVKRRVEHGVGDMLIIAPDSRAIFLGAMQIM